MDHHPGPSDYLGDPGPQDPDLLFLQNKHRSEAVWQYQVYVKLKKLNPSLFKMLLTFQLFFNRRSCWKVIVSRHMITRSH